MMSIERTPPPRLLFGGKGRTSVSGVSSHHGGVPSVTAKHLSLWACLETCRRLAVRCPALRSASLAVGVRDGQESHRHPGKAITPSPLPGPAVGSRLHVQGRARRLILLWCETQSWTRRLYLHVHTCLLFLAAPTWQNAEIRNMLRATLEGKLVGFLLLCLALLYIHSLED